MSEQNLNKNRIAKNTFYLFIRMFITMCVSLYTSRIVLEALGVENYGIFNIAGGLVAFVSYINWGMSSASQRFIMYSLGADPPEMQRQVVSNSWGLHLIICGIILLLGETVGVWFFFNELVIPEDSLSSAFIIYQLSIGSTILAILTIPFTSLIMAHERMSVYAYMTILDVTFKLGICYLLFCSDGDRLILYGFLLFGTQVIYSLINWGYCVKHFPESHLNFKWKRSIMKKMTGFAGWSMVGCTASILQGQGMNILLNIFGGPVLNAARGLAVQVQGTVTGMVGNFQAAVVPQLIKSYASGRLNDMHSLIFSGSKYSFFLMFAISLPLMCNIHEVLSIWLTEVPEYTGIFLNLIMINSLIGTLSGPLMKSADSTGDIKKYHIVVGGSLLLVLPFAYLTLKIGLPVYYVFVVQTLFAVLSLYLRLWVLRPMISLKISAFCENVIWPIIRVVIPVTIIMVGTLYVLPSSGLVKFVLSSTIGEVVVLTFIWRLGLKESERKQWAAKIKNILNKLFVRRWVRA